jgi:hypothetical protein
LRDNQGTVDLHRYTTLEEIDARRRELGEAEFISLLDSVAQMVTVSPEAFVQEIEQAGIEWDWWMLPWIDRGAMGLERQGNSPLDVILTNLLRSTVDKYGYTWGASLRPEPRDSLGGWTPTFGWPWPKYNRNYTVTRPTGWEFNDPRPTAPARKRAIHLIP